MKTKQCRAMAPEALERCFFQHAPDKLSTNLDGEVVMMDLHSGTYSSFNPVGSLIWNSLQQENQFSALLTAILDQFDVDEERATQELVVFLDMLLEKGLITMAERPPE